MYKKITKTAAQARMDNESEEQEKLDTTTCPECHYQSVLNCKGIYTSRVTGFLFNVKVIYTHYMRCRECGCEWEYEAVQK